MPDLEDYLASIRGAGWTVAVHNDYTIGGQFMTFWLFTNKRTGQFVKGEGPHDRIVLKLILDEVRRG